MTSSLFHLSCVGLGPYFHERYKILSQIHEPTSRTIDLLPGLCLSILLGTLVLFCCEQQQAAFHQTMGGFQPLPGMATYTREPEYLRCKVTMEILIDHFNIQVEYLFVKTLQYNSYVCLFEHIFIVTNFAMKNGHLLEPLSVIHDMLE